MSDRTAAVAIDTMLITDTPSEEMGMDMFGLLEAIDFEYERWCRIIGMDPDDPESEDVYDAARYNYTKAWAIAGESEFAKMMGPLCDKWKRIVGPKEIT